MNSRLSRNVLANVLQAIVGAGLLFALYRYINITLGVEQLGVWSVVLATVSTSRLADLGLSAGVTRFVARDRARGKPNRASQVIDTVALTLMATVGAVLPLIYLLLIQLLPHLFDANHLTRAEELLPYALASLWLTIIAAVFQGGLDGCERMDLRAALMVAGQALLLGLALWLVPHRGLIGLAWAQIGQGLFLIVVGRLLLRCALPELPRLPLRWNHRVLREMLGYGANVQAMTIIMLFFDPITKMLMIRFGGPAAAGYFEMASQVVLKVRAVIVTANQSIVPHVAALAETKPTHLARLYRENMRVLIFVALPTFTLLIAWAGGLSWLLVSTYQPEFVFMVGLLAIAWGVNVFNAPAYFVNMGTGQVGLNTLSHLILAVNAPLGWLLGSRYGAHGVALAYATALVTASVLLIVVFHRRQKIGWGCEFASEHLGLVTACAAVATLGYLVPVQMEISGNTAALVAGLLLPPLALGFAVWAHPLRRQIWQRLMSREANL